MFSAGTKAINSGDDISSNSDFSEKAINDGVAYWPFKYPLAGILNSFRVAYLVIIKT